MSAPNASEFPGEIALPYKLKRPQFVFFRGLSMVLIVILSVLALLRYKTVLALVALLGGAFWLVMGLILLANWQVVTLGSDYLLVCNYGKSQRVPYAEVRTIEVTSGARGMNGPTALPTVHIHRVGVNKALKINLANLAIKDRRILVRVIRSRAPKSQLDALGKLLAKGEWNG